MTVWRAATYLVARRRSGAARLELFFAFGICLLTVLTLAFVASFHVAERQTQRSETASPVLDYNTDASRSASAMVDPTLVPDRRWNGQEVERVFVATTSTNTPLQPGVRRFPAPDEYLASPALLDAMRTDSAIAALFEGKELVGTIGDAGLTSRGSLKAIVGVPATTPFLVGVKGFGSSSPSPGTMTEDDATLNTVVTTLALVLVVLPTVVMLLVVSRLAGRARQARGRSLRLIGMSTTSVRATEALMVLPWMVPAGLLGLVLFDLARRWGSIPGTSVDYFPEDARLAPVLLAAVVTCSIFAGCVLSAMSISLSEDADDTRRSSRAWKQAGRVGLTVLGLGACVLVGMPILRSVLGEPANFLLWPACAAVALGLALGGPSVVTRLAARGADRTSSVSALVGLRMVADGSSTVLRVASVVCVLIVLLLGTQSFLNILNGGTTSDWQERADEAAAVPTTITDLGGRETLAGLEDAIGDAPAIQVRELETAAGGTIRVVLGDCGGLAGVSGRPIAGCGDQPAWIDVGERSGGPTSTSGFLRVGSTSIEVSTLPRLKALNLPSDVDEAVFVPGTEIRGPSGSGSVFYAILDSQGLNTTLARVAAGNPTAQLDLGELDRLNPDTQQFPGQVEWIKIAAAVGFAIGALGVAAGAVGEAHDRASRFRSLDLLGASRPQKVKIHAFFTATPMLLLGLAASSIGLLVSVAFRVLDERATVPATTFTATVLGAVVSSLLIFVISIPGRSPAKR